MCHAVCMVDGIFIQHLWLAKCRCIEADFESHGMWLKHLLSRTSVCFGARHVKTKEHKDGFVAVLVLKDGFGIPSDIDLKLEFR